jgi:hypothetical protein
MEEVEHMLRNIWNPLGTQSGVYNNMGTQLEYVIDSKRENCVPI